MTGAQYVIELVCEQKAKHAKKDLPLQFWKLPEWEKYFVSQTRAVHKLLQTYDERAIISAVKKSRIRNLMPKWVVKVVAEHDTERKVIQSALAEEIAKRPEPQERIIDVPKRRTARHGTSAIDKLLALDIEGLTNGEEEEKS